MRKWIGILCVVVLIGCFVSCSDESEIIYVPVEEEEVLITDQSGSTVVNTKDIVIGEGEDEVVFEMVSTILDADKGKITERTLNCCVLGALALDGGAVDSTQSVEHVTLINKGTITIHTKDLVARYADMIQTPDDKTRPYTYFRILVMYAGKNSTVVNEGTINVYFDHDPTLTSTVYVMAMISGEGSSMMNNGEIHFYGNGSVATRLRGMATFGDNISAINNGTMTAELDMAEDSRMITTGGTKSNVINNGTMEMRLPGKVFCMTRYGDSNLINNSVINLTSVDVPEGYTPLVSEDDYIICAMYEPLSGARTGMPSLLNRGTINVAIEGSADTTPYKQAYGMCCDLMAKGGGRIKVNVVNEGDINVRQSGPLHFDMAEAGFVVRKAGGSEICNVKVGKWKTTLRDFSQTHDLFLAKGVNMDFSGSELQLAKDADYVDNTPYSVAPEALLYNAGGENYEYVYTGYESLDIKSSNMNIGLNWDREKQEVSLYSKQ